MARGGLAGNHASQRSQSPVEAPLSDSVPKPSRQSLARGLSEVFSAEIATRGPLRVRHRRTSPRLSTYPADVVRVEFADGSSEHLLCKYAHGVEHAAFSPHQGLAHEARVYETLLRYDSALLPRYWGSFTDDETGDFAFVMRFYPGEMNAAQACEQGGLTELIRWMAAFHTWGESQVAEPGWGFLTRYDEPYYAHWLDLTSALARPMAQDFPWLDQVAAAYRERISLLTRRPQTIIHGELTTRNTLWADGRIMVIDWETAAVGPAEIDLALFTFDWDLEDVRSLEESYVHARWQGSAPTGFTEVMLAARLYVAYHWIFSSPDGRDEARVRSHLETVQRKAARWGIIPASYLIP